MVHYADLPGCHSGWEARAGDSGGAVVRPVGSFAIRKGSARWRTRDSAATGIAFDAVQNKRVPKGSVPVKTSRAR